MVHRRQFRGGEGLVELKGFECFVECLLLFFSAFFIFLGFRFLGSYVSIFFFLFAHLNF